MCECLFRSLADEAQTYIHTHTHNLQLILERVATPKISEVKDLDATPRGTGGFGSTGL